LSYGPAILGRGLYTRVGSGPETAASKRIIGQLILIQT
jgi:hypothetical protein